MSTAPLSGISRRALLFLANNDVLEIAGYNLAYDFMSARSRMIIVFEDQALPRRSRSEGQRARRRETCQPFNSLTRSFTLVVPIFSAQWVSAGIQTTCSCVNTIS